MSESNPVLAVLGASPQEYARLGIDPRHVEPREDGMRTDGGKGTFEWWYFDARLADGSKLVITFYTKDFNDTDQPLAPYANVVYDGADGTHLSAKTAVLTGSFSASTDECDVRIGPNRFVGDLHTYDIHIETDQIEADVTLTGTVPSWRPATGHFFFENDESLYFAWLAAVPQGDVRATITIGGEKTERTGVGYHDHNWGNVSMMQVINNWYWARGQAGPWTVIACYLTAEARYGFTKLPIFMLANDGKVVADDNTHVSFEAAEVHVDGETGKPVSDLLTYTYADGDASYVVTWRRKATILRDKFIDELHGFRHLLAELVGYDGAYLRFTGELTVARVEGGKAGEPASGDAIWELMYFGETHASRR